MTFLPPFVIAILAGAQRSMAATKFVPDGDSLIVATSVEPCTLIGDPDLYGLGVRVAFYISFAMSLIAIICGRSDELKIPRLSFNVLFASLLIILVLNVHQGSFAIFEWYIVTGLALVSASSVIFYLPTDEDEEKEDTPVEDNEENDEVTHTERDTHMSGAQDRGLEASSGITPGSSKGHQSRDIEANTHDQQDAEQERFVQTFAYEKYRILLSGPVSFGFTFLLYGIFALMQPWLYYTHMHSGHREGCPVPVTLFGTFDMYNEHWQRWLKASAALGVLASLIVFLPLAMFFILFGATTRQHRAAALLELDKKLDKRIQKAKRIEKQVEQHQREQNEEEQQDRKPIGQEKTPTNKAEPQQIRKIMKEMIRDRAKGWKWKRTGDKVKEDLQEVREKRITAWIQRVPYLVFFAVFSGLSIYFIERTLQLNQVDLGKGLTDSSGQMLALLVAVFTSLGFLSQVLSNYLDGKRRRDELTDTLARIDRGIDEVVFAVDREVANKQRQLGELLSFQRMSERFPRPRGRPAGSVSVGGGA